MADSNASRAKYGGRIEVLLSPDDDRRVERARKVTGESRGGFARRVLLEALAKAEHKTRYGDL